MSDLTSTVIKNLRSLNRGQFIGTHLSSTRTINHVVKIYQNHDVKIKTLHSPIIVPRSGFEELTLETSTAINAIPKIINNEIVLTKHKTISYYKFVPTVSPEKRFCPKYYINPELKSVVNSKGLVLFDSSLLDKNGKSIYQEILSKKIKNLPRVRSRTLENIYDILHGKEFDYFLTVTFDDSKIDRSNPSLCSKVLRKRLNNIKNKVKGCSQLEYFGVWEYHKDLKSIHYHLLVKGIPDHYFTPAIDTRTSYVYQGKILPNKYYGQQLKSNNKLIYNLSLISFGFTTASRIVDNNKSISYIIKYILPFGSSRSSSVGSSVYDVLNDSKSLLPRSTVVYPSLCDDDNVLLNTPLYNYDTTSLLPIYDPSSEIALTLSSSLLRPLSNPPINLFDNRYLAQNLNFPPVYNFGLSLLPLVGVPFGVRGEYTCFNLCLCLCLCLCPSFSVPAVIFSVYNPLYGLSLDMSYVRSSDFINRFFPVSIDDGLDPSLLPYAPAVRRYINSATIRKPRKISIDTPTLLKLAHNPDNEISVLTDSLNVDLVEFIQPLSENTNEILLFRNSIVKSKKEI